MRSPNGTSGAASKADIASLPDAIKRGEEQAYIDFFTVFGPPVKQLYYGGVNPAELDDVVLNVLTELCLRISHFQARAGVNNFAAWVMVCARHHLVDYLRRKDPLRDAILFNDQYEAHQAYSEKETDRQAMLIAMLWDAIAQLSTPLQAVMQIYLRGGEMTSRDVAEELGIRPEAVRVRRARALEELEAILVRDPRSKVLRVSRKSGGEQTGVLP